MQKHSKCPKTEGISAQKTLKFHRLGAFYMAFGGYFLLEWFGRKTLSVKYIYCFNKSLTADFGGKANGYAAGISDKAKRDGRNDENKFKSSFRDENNGYAAA